MCVLQFMPQVIPRRNLVSTKYLYKAQPLLAFMFYHPRQCNFPPLSLFLCIFPAKDFMFDADLSSQNRHIGDRVAFD